MKMLIDNSVAEFWMKEFHDLQKLVAARSDDLRYKELYEHELAKNEALQENIDDSWGAIVSACEKVGKDINGKFPVNAYDLACMIIDLRSRGGLG
jgi:hypothetical protein